jgi:hypothetical protein
MDNNVVYSCVTANIRYDSKFDIYGTVHSRLLSININRWTDMAKLVVAVRVEI